MNSPDRPDQEGASGDAIQRPSLTDDITWEAWGGTPDGRAVTLYHLQTPEGIRVSVTNYGGVIVRLLTPDRAKTSRSGTSIASRPLPSARSLAGTRTVSPGAASI
jgi:hypothetical protein